MQLPLYFKIIIIQERFLLHIMLKKIVLIGPESTGKSTLGQSLARYYNTEFVPEYAREYLLKNGTKYTYDDILIMAKQQLKNEDFLCKKLEEQQAIKNSSKSIPLFIDTDMYVAKVWCEFVFNDCHNFILDQIVNRKYDLYLLCNIDLPWIADELREYPDLEKRKELFNIYKDLMINQHVPWVIINGNHEQRLQLAIEATNKILNTRA